MRVLFATYPWAFETPGGGEIQLQKYADHLPSHGVEVRLHDPWSANLDQASVFHFFSCMGGSTHLCNYVKQRGLPLVISSSLWLTDATRHRYPVAEIRAQLSLADLVITNSIMESDALARVLDLPQELFAVVANGFEPRFATATPTAFREAFPVPETFVLNIGNLEPRKNQLTLVRALKRLGLPLVLIGHLRDRAYAEQVFAEGGSRLHYLGPLDHGDPRLASAFAACNVFVLPSVLETPGLAALEAAAAGAPLVLTAEGSTREYFEGLADYVDPSDPGRIAAGVENALANGRNPLLKAHVEKNYSWPLVTKALPALYRLAQSRHQARAAGLTSK